MTPFDGEIARWTASAPIWVSEAPLIARMTAAVTSALVDALDPRPGESLLDIACGPGDPVFPIVAATAGRGRVVAMDPVAEMIAEVAARRRGRCPLPVQGRAEAVPLSTGSLDGVSCRFGAMFVDDPPGFARELHRVLKPGGRAVLAVWGAPAVNPYFTVVHQALDAAGAPPADRVPGQRTVFEWAAPGDLARHLHDADFADVEEWELPFGMTVEQTTPDAFLDRQVERSPPLADRIARAGPGVVDAARRELARLVAPWDRDGAIAFPALARVLRARR